MQVSNRIKFSGAHTWVRLDGAVATIGLSEWAQAQIGEVASFRLPEVGDSFDANTTLGRIVGEFGAAELVAPVAGDVLEINAEILEDPGLINTDPHDTGWIVRLEVLPGTEVDGLLDEDDYAEMTSEL
ncbi:MAG: glycine cleavage system protein H [Candidatus Dormibacteria bacterium]